MSSKGVHPPQGRGMGHIGQAGSQAAFGSNAIRRKEKQSSSLQDPAIDLSPAVRRSDSVSSNAGWDSGRVNGARQSRGDGFYKSSGAGAGSTVCRREAFYVVEVRSECLMQNELLYCYSMQITPQTLLLHACFLFKLTAPAWHRGELGLIPCLNILFWIFFSFFILTLHV